MFACVTTASREPCCPMTTIEPLIRSHSCVVEPFAGVEAVEELLLRQGFLVVMDGASFLGLIVVEDILEWRHTLVIDCVRPKPTIGPGESLRRAFGLMKRYRLPVLPVVERERFIGVVTQTALLEHLADRGDSFERRIAAHARELWSLNQSLTAEIALRKRAESRAREANRAKSRFLADVSHEIRTPLHVVVGLCQRLGEQATGIDRDTLVGQLRRIQEAGEHLFGLVERMLDLARIEAGLVTVRPEPLEPARFLEDLTIWFVPEARVRGNRLELRVDGGIGTVLADPLRLRQVLFNLLANANRHTDRGEITLALELVTADAGRRVLRFQVEDTGCGIPAERMETLFEPFVLGAGGRCDATGGNGLGLALSRALVEAMGGAIEVTSHPGEGSCFSFVLDCPIASGSDRATDPSSEAFVVAPMTLLLIEDDRLSRAYMRELLVAEGHRVVESGDSGQDPLSALGAESIDLVLTDLRLDDRDGVEIIRAMRALPDARLARVPIVVLTADTRPERHQAALEAGAWEVLTKPLLPDGLRAALARIQKKMPDQAGGGDPPLCPTVLLDAALLDAGARTLGRERFLAICVQYGDTEARGRIELAEALARSDWPAMRRVLHRISGSAAHLGMKALVAHAGAWIEMLGEWMPEDQSGRLAAFDALSKRSLEALERWMVANAGAG